MRTLGTLALLLIVSPLVSAPGDGPTASPCYLTVTVPIGATLLVNGARTSQMTASRRFVSPPLPFDKTFYYTFDASWTSHGEMVGAKRQVPVKAGENLAIDLTTPKANAPAIPVKPKKDEAFKDAEEPKKPAPKPPADEPKKPVNPFRDR